MIFFFFCFLFAVGSSDPPPTAGLQPNPYCECWGLSLPSLFVQQSSGASAEIKDHPKCQWMCNSASLHPLKHLEKMPVQGLAAACLKHRPSLIAFYLGNAFILIYPTYQGKASRDPHCGCLYICFLLKCK